MVDGSSFHMYALARSEQPSDGLAGDESCTAGILLPHTPTLPPILSTRLQNVFIRNKTRNFFCHKTAPLTCQFILLNLKHFFFFIFKVIVFDLNNANLLP
jgi:hypothetical protein